MNPFKILLLMSTQIAGIACQFSYPPDGRILFRVGDVRAIRYKTDWEEYTIALWQQSKSGKSAVLGPVVFETRDGPEKGFDWTVKTYDFDLRDSEVFFFWAFEGDRSNQGDQTMTSMSSAYFRIAEEDRGDDNNGGNDDNGSGGGEICALSAQQPTTPRPSPTAAGKSELKPSVECSTAGGDELKASEETPVSTESTKPSTTKIDISTTSDEPQKFSVASASPRSSPTSSSTPAGTLQDQGATKTGGAPTGSSASHQEEADAPKPLSTGAKAGIGIGVSAGGITLVAGVILLARWWKTRRDYRHETASVLFWCRGRREQNGGVWRPPVEN